MNKATAISICGAAFATIAAHRNMVTTPDQRAANDAAFTEHLEVLDYLRENLEDSDAQQE